MWSSPTLRYWKTPFFFRILWPLFVQTPVWRRYFFSGNINYYVPSQHNPTCACSKCDPKPSELFLFSGFGSGPGITWISWMKLHSLLSTWLVLSMGLVVIKFILPNLRLIPCFDGLCSSASHSPWIAFDARTERGRCFFHSLMCNSEHLDISRICYTHIPLL